MHVPPAVKPTTILRQLALHPSSITREHSLDATPDGETVSADGGRTYESVVAYHRKTIIAEKTSRPAPNRGGLRGRGWEDHLRRHLRYGGKVLGLCGGFQMLGNRIDDPRGIEGAPGSTPGLGLLDFATELHPEKQLHNVSGTLVFADAAVSGYEIHAGISSGPALQRPAARLPGRDDGAISDDGQTPGTYLHGLFDQKDACDALLRWAGLHEADSPDPLALREAELNRLADAVEQHLDLAAIIGMLKSESANERPWTQI